MYLCPAVGGSLLPHPPRSGVCGCQLAAGWGQGAARCGQVKEGRWDVTCRSVSCGPWVLGEGVWPPAPGCLLWVETSDRLGEPAGTCAGSREEDRCLRGRPGRWGGGRCAPKVGGRGCSAPYSLAGGGGVVLLWCVWEAGVGSGQRRPAFSLIFIPPPPSFRLPSHTPSPETRSLLSGGGGAGRWPGWKAWQGGGWAGSGWLPSSCVYAPSLPQHRWGVVDSAASAPSAAPTSLPLCLGLSLPNFRAFPAPAHGVTGHGNDTCCHLVGGCANTFTPLAQVTRAIAGPQLR